MEVGQAVENLQKQLSEVRRVAYSASTVDTSPIYTTLGPPLSADHAAAGDTIERSGSLKASHVRNVNLVEGEAATTGEPNKANPLFLAPLARGNEYPLLSHEFGRFWWGAGNHRLG